MFEYGRFFLNKSSFQNMADINIFGLGFDANLLLYEISILIYLVGGSLLIHLGTEILLFEKKEFTRVFGIIFFMLVPHSFFD